MIDIEKARKLEIGKRYKYKELCMMFDEEQVDGSSKPAQKRRWESCFKWTNPSSQAYLIEEIYDEPLPIKDGRVNNGGNSTSKFLLLDDLLIYYLDEVESIKCTIPQLSINLGIMSEYYSQYRLNPSWLAKDSNVSKELVEYMLIHIRSCVNNAIVSSIERLTKEKHINAESYYILCFENGSKVKLDKEQSAKIVDWEKETLKELGYTRQDLRKQECYKAFQNEMNTVLFEELNLQCKYYYKEYNLERTDSQYKEKSNETESRLTRKFFITIGINMLKSICYLTSGKNRIEYSQIELIEDTIKLANRLFVNMQGLSWEAYWGEDELSMNNEDKAMLFWSQFCLTNMQMKSGTKNAKEKIYAIESNVEFTAFEDCRQHAIEILSEEDVLYFEKIIPDIDWKQIVNSIEENEYIIKCLKAIETYQDNIWLYEYCENDPAEEYSLYLAREVMKNGDIESAMDLFEFKKHINWQ